MSNETGEEKPDRALQRVSENFEKILNSHGHSFHQAVLKQQEELYADRKSGWALFGTEIPVRCGNEVTHIDIVNEDARVNRIRNRDYFLICECKRVNPAKGHWCFASTQYTWRNHDDSVAQFDRVQCFSSLPQFTSSTKSRRTTRKVFSLGLEARTGEPGDSSGAQHKSEINYAVGQVLKACSGFINYVSDESRNVEVLTLDRPVIVVPVIFTTARLFTTDADLGDAQLENGLLPSGSVEVKEVDWLWYNVNRSPWLSHDVRIDYSIDDGDERFLNRHFREFTRSIAIVGARGVNKFLSFDLDDWLY